MATDPTHKLSFADSLWVALALILAVLPHVPRMPWWVGGLALAVLAWHLYLARMRLAAPGHWTTAALVIGAAAAIYLQFRTLFGRDAGVALLIVMLALKLLEMKTRREAALVLTLGFFVVLTNFLYSQTLLTAAYLLLCVWLIAAAMTRLQQRTQAASQPLALSTAGALLAQSVPLMLALFVLFPRVQGPLWGMPADAHTGLSGLSGTMTPGSMSNLILSDSVAFRAQFQSRIPAAEALYWRGPVLSHFDGRTWTAPPAREHSAPHFQTESKPLVYTVTLEPHNKRWLFALDLPGVVPPGSAATYDMQLLSRTLLTSRMRYDMVSYPDYRYGLDETSYALQRALQLPAGANPRTLEFARILRRRYADDKALINAVLAMFRQDGYVYTLTPPLTHRQPVDEFLFDTRQGFCEHYSSAFAIVMRAAGIPARIVTGYLGGEVNPVGDYLIVRQADAHAWTEVWLRDAGWVRIDPTAAVSPERVERGIAAVDAAAQPFFARADFPLLRRLHLGWDTVAYRWNQWVLGYNPERQRHVASSLGLGTTWRDLAIALAITAGIIIAILGLLMLRSSARHRLDAVGRAYERCCKSLGKAGFPRAPHEGALAYGMRVAMLRPDLAREVTTIAGLYSDLRYGHETKARIAELVAAVKRLQARL